MAKRPLKGRAFPITEQQARGYDYVRTGGKMSRNGGVTTIAAINGPGAYRAARSARVHASGLGRNERLALARKTLEEKQMAHRPTAAQIRARERFAQLARSGRMRSNGTLVGAPISRNGGTVRMGAALNDPRSGATARMGGVKRSDPRSPRTGATSRMGGPGARTAARRAADEAAFAKAMRSMDRRSRERLALGSVRTGSTKRMGASAPGERTAAPSKSAKRAQFLERMRAGRSKARKARAAVAAASPPKSASKKRSKAAQAASKALALVGAPASGTKNKKKGKTMAAAKKAKGGSGRRKLSTRSKKAFAERMARARSAKRKGRAAAAAAAAAPKPKSKSKKRGKTASARKRAAQKAAKTRAANKAKRQAAARKAASTRKRNQAAAKKRATSKPKTRKSRSKPKSATRRARKPKSTKQRAYTASRRAAAARKGWRNRKAGKAPAARKSKKRSSKKRMRKNGYGSMRRNRSLDAVFTALKIGAAIAGGFMAHKALTHLVNRLVLDRVMPASLPAPAATAGADAAPPLKSLVGGALVAGVGVYATNQLISDPETKALVAGGMVASVVHSVAVAVIEQIAPAQAPMLSGSEDGTAARLAAMYGLGDGYSLQPRYAPIGEYFSQQGVGEYFSQQGVGEYFSQQGVGEYFESGTAGLGNYVGNADIYQAAAGYGETFGSNTNHVDPSADLEHQLTLVEAAAGVGTLPDYSAAAGYGADLYQAAAGYGAVGPVATASTWIPGDTNPSLWAGVKAIDEGQGETAMLPAGVLATPGGSGILG